LVEVLNPHIQESYANLNEVKPAEIFYKSTVENISTNIEKNKEIYEGKILEVHQQEIERGLTLFGPHRDDLQLQLGPFPAKGYASHGESWSMAIALRLGSFNLLKKEGAEPILILDDIFAELDNSRRQQLLNATTMAEQTIITAAVSSDIPEGLAGERKFVSLGQVTEGGA